jgi:hypothetical protein
MDAMHELSNGRLGKIKCQRFKDGLSYQETRFVLKSDVDLPDEVTSKNTDGNPTTDEVAGEERGRDQNTPERDTNLT